jgi:hypothetical protein
VIQSVKTCFFKKQSVIFIHNARRNANLNGISALNGPDQTGDTFCSSFTWTPACVYHAVAKGAGLKGLSGFSQYLFFILLSILDDFRLAAFGLRAVVAIF